MSLIYVYPLDIKPTSMPSRRIWIRFYFICSISLPYPYEAE